MTADSAIARPSVASLLIRAIAGSNVLGSATGFAVGWNGVNYLITNWHVVSGRDPRTNQPLHSSGAVPSELRTMHNVKDRLGQWREVADPLYNGAGQPLWREHPDFGRRVDVVALPLSSMDDVELYRHDPWTVEPEIAAGVAEGVFIIGFPFGLSGGGSLGIWSRGSIATEPAVEFDGLPLYLVDSRTRAGQSGSPVIFYSGGGAVAMRSGGVAVFAGPVERLLGVYSGRVNQESDLGFVWKVSALREIVERGVRPV